MRQSKVGLNGRVFPSSADMPANPRNFVRLCPGWGRYQHYQLDAQPFGVSIRHFLLRYPDQFVGENRRFACQRENTSVRHP